MPSINFTSPGTRELAGRLSKARSCQRSAAVPAAACSTTPKRVEFRALIRQSGRLRVEATRTHSLGQQALLRIAEMSNARGLKLERGLQAASAGKRKTGIEFHVLQPYGKRSGLKPALRCSILRASIGTIVETLFKLIRRQPVGFVHIIEPVSNFAAIVGIVRVAQLERVGNKFRLPAVIQQS